MNYEQAMKNCIFRYVAGSHSYGTNTESSDMDYRGVFVAPLEKAFDLFQSSFVGSGSPGGLIRSAIDDIDAMKPAAAKECLRKALETDQGDLNMSVQTVRAPDGDEELQELRKFLKLAADCNPNIIEFLYVDRLVTHTTPTWEKIKANRGMFLSKKARYTFSGYAVAQLRRIKTHRGYLMSPPKAMPERKDFGLENETVIPKEHQNAILSIGDRWLRDDVKDYVAREKAYQSALDEWRSYKNWEKERNAARKRLEAAHGYDTKHASHLVRLARMARQILEEGTLSVYRPDREELLAIRNGAWPYEKLVEFADGIDESLESLYKASSLRNAPDHKGISALYAEICEEAYGIKLRGRDA